MDKLLNKKKTRWTMQLFKYGVATAEPMWIRISNRPPLPWNVFHREPIPRGYEMTIDMEEFHDLDGTIPHVVISNGDGEPLEEWDLLGVKVYSIEEWDAEYSSDNKKLWSFKFKYDDTTYKCPSLCG